MAKKMNALRREQLDNLIFPSGKRFELKRPKDGWVREIRKALGMSMEDLANRIGVIKQRVERIEKDEVKEKLTIESLRKAAEAMNCELVYFFASKTSLEATVKDAARKLAEKLVKETNVSMNLEKQGVDEQYSDKLIRELTEEFMRAGDKRIWKMK